MPITDTRDQIIQKKKYRKNIKGDKFLLYISSYPVAAEYLSGRLKGKGSSIAELCCGVGITLEALAKNFDEVIGVDNDKEVLSDCIQNINSAGYQRKVTLIKGDIQNVQVLESIKTDIVIYDIPYWVSHMLEDGTDILEKNPKFKEMILKIRKYITQNIVIFAPRNFDASLLNGLGDYELEQIFINGKHDRNYIYFGKLIDGAGATKKDLVTEQRIPN